MSMNVLNVQGIEIPVLGYGTWKMSGEDCYDGVTTALNVGYRHIDTAQRYGNEDAVGKAIQKSGVGRSNIFLTTKVWIDEMKNSTVTQSIDESLKKLDTDYVDLLLMHWPFEGMDLAGILDEFVAAQKAGKTRLIGVSNFTVAMMEEVKRLGVTIANNQVEYHPLLSQKPVLTHARQENIAVTAYSPMAQGDVLKQDVLQDIGASHNKSAAQVALRWLVQQEGVMTIPKSSSEDRMKSNMDIFDFTLSDAELAAIEALPKNIRTVDPTFAPKWDEA